MDSLSAMSLEDISKKEKDLESSGQVNILTFDIMLHLRFVISFAINVSDP